MAASRIPWWGWALIATVALAGACEVRGIISEARPFVDAWRANQNVDASMTTEWQEKYGVSRAWTDLREATPAERQKIEEALSDDRERGCGAYEVQTGALSLRVRCSPKQSGSVTEYLVYTHGDPYVMDYRLGRAR